jgi:hypothetical protein
MCSPVRVHLTCSSTSSRPIVRKEVILTGMINGIETHHDETPLSEHATFPGLQRRVSSLQPEKRFVHAKLWKRSKKEPKVIVDTTSVAVIQVRRSWMP